MVFYRSTNNFNFDLIKIQSWEYSPVLKGYVVEFIWKDKNKVLTGFLLSVEPPSREERYVVGGYDISKGMWHIVKQKK